MFVSFSTKTTKNQEPRPGTRGRLRRPPSAKGLGKPDIPPGGVVQEPSVTIEHESPYPVHIHRHHPGFQEPGFREVPKLHFNPIVLMGVGSRDPAVRARKGGQDGVPGVGRRQAGQIFTVVVPDTTIVPQNEMYKIERKLGEQGGQGGHRGRSVRSYTYPGDKRVDVYGLPRRRSRPVGRPLTIPSSVVLGNSRPRHSDHGSTLLYRPGRSWYEYRGQSGHRSRNYTAVSRRYNSYWPRGPG